MKRFTIVNSVQEHFQPSRMSKLTMEQQQGVYEVMNKFIMLQIKDEVTQENMNEPAPKPFQRIQYRITVAISLFPSVTYNQQIPTFSRKESQSKITKTACDQQKVTTERHVLRPQAAWAAQS